MNLANILTLSRIIVVPVIAVLLLTDNWITSLIAAFLFLCAAITDYLDGYLARKLHMESDLGKLLDPLADKLLISTVLIMLIPLGRVYAWMAAIIIMMKMCSRFRSRRKRRSTRRRFSHGSTMSVRFRARIFCEPKGS